VVFVAFVLDGDGKEAAVLAGRDRIRLAAEIAGRFDFLRGDVDDGEIAGRLGIALRGVDAGQHFCADHHDRGRLAVDLDDASGLRRLRVGDVDEADGAQRAVGIDERVAVFRGGDDFGRRRRGRIGAFRQVGRNRDGCDTIEDLIGVGRKSDGSCKCGHGRDK
jgi:hypothetical protein